MSYRREGKKIHAETGAWQQWLAENEDLVARSGIPSYVLRTPEDWWYFVRNTYYRPFRHGDDIQCPWFDVDQLAPANKEALWTLIVAAVNSFCPDHQTRYPNWLASLARTYAAPGANPQ